VLVSAAKDGLGAIRRQMLALLAERVATSTWDGEPFTPRMRWPARTAAHAATRTLAHRHRDLARRRLIAHLMGDR
jgi:hypothetical protein